MVDIAPTPVLTLSLPIPTPAPSPVHSPTPSPSPVPGDGRVTLFADFWYKPLDDTLKARITGLSYPAEGEDCLISYDDLRYLSILYVDFDGVEHIGELIVNTQLAEEVLEIFHALYTARYPLASVRLVDEFGEAADDNLSMAANNTSAFNYRLVSGSSSLSLHSYGTAIDINPLMNPYIRGSRISPPEAKAYADRSLDLPGMIDHEDLCYQLFTERGWRWGGDWTGYKDYQHFSKDLGY